jgi:hypothetical protein
MVYLYHFCMSAEYSWQGNSDRWRYARRLEEIFAAENESTQDDTQKFADMPEIFEDEDTVLSQEAVRMSAPTQDNQPRLGRRTEPAPFYHDTIASPHEQTASSGEDK